MKRIEVVAGLIVRGGRVFAARRAAGGEAGLLWEFPGGKVEPGEDHAAALARELAEELGVDARIGGRLMTVEHQCAAFHLTMHCLWVGIGDAAPCLHEHVESRWLAAGELDDVDWAPADRPVVERVRGFLSGAGSADTSGMEQSSYFLQKAPFRVPTDDGKLIEEHFGRASTGTTEFSLARMVAPPGWAEPPQSPEFDELTILISGRKRVELDGRGIDLEPGQSILVRRGSTVRYSNPFGGAAEYWSVCMPAFSPDTVHRTEKG
jgi:mutator protein MutT